ncbi:hypothetical protein [Mesorhizobium sp.]|uniref:hypothetical protein n=1 Tax=Mesorhizobium sp. TaxID=1871066 RepID=UPI00257D6044|nr:hypothetical protein [Mesorhizobium sp.]
MLGFLPSRFLTTGPGYDVIAQPRDLPAQRISIKSRTFKKGTGNVGYNDYDLFDWLAIVLLPAGELTERRIYVIPRALAENLARRDKPTSMTAAERYFRVDQVPELFAAWRSNFPLVGQIIPAGFAETHVAG